MPPAICVVTSFTPKTTRRLSGGKFHVGYVFCYFYGESAEKPIRFKSDAGTISDEMKAINPVTSMS